MVAPSHDGSVPATGTPNKPGLRRFRSRYRDPRYTVWRLAVLERDRWTCQQCGHVAHPRERHFAAHHIKGYAAYPELRFDVSNGIALCYDCHWREHAIYARDRKQVPCACGCGTLIWNVSDWGEPRRYVSNHHWRGRKRPGRVTSDDTRAKQSQSMKDYWHDRPRVGRPQSPETRAKIGASSTGRTHTAQSRAKMSAVQSARFAEHPVSDATRANLSQSHMGHTPTPETRARLSQSMKDYWKDKPRVGRPQSAETRAKISATLRAKRRAP